MNKRGEIITKQPFLFNFGIDLSVSYPSTLLPFKPLRLSILYRISPVNGQLTVCAFFQAVPPAICQPLHRPP